MNSEKELLTRALGVDEPPLSLDIEALAAANLRRRRPHPVLSLVGTAAAVAIVGGGAVLVTAQSPSQAGSSGALDPGEASGTPGVSVAAPSRRDIAYCYRTADLNSQEPNQHVPIGINGKGKDGRGDVAAVAMEICSSAWRDNPYDWQQQPAASPGQHQYAIPALVSCVLDSHAVGVESGAVGVFPGDATTCARLGLSVAQLP